MKATAKREEGSRPSWNITFPPKCAVQIMEKNQKHHLIPRKWTHGPVLIRTRVRALLLPLPRQRYGSSGRLRVGLWSGRRQLSIEPVEGEAAVNAAGAGRRRILARPSGTHFRLGEGARGLSGLLGGKPPGRPLPGGGAGFLGGTSGAAGLDGLGSGAGLSTENTRGGKRRR